MNLFCKDIVRSALIRYANLTDDAAMKRQAEWVTIFTRLIEKSNEPAMPVPQRIEVRRAVAMMQRRMYRPGSSEFLGATELLRDAAAMACRFYGPRSQALSDMQRTLS